MLECLTACNSDDIVISVLGFNFTGADNDFKSGEEVVSFSIEEDVTRTNTSGGGVAITGTNYLDVSFDISGLVCNENTNAAFRTQVPLSCGTAIFDSGCCGGAITLSAVTMTITPASIVTGGDAPTYSISGTGRMKAGGA